VKGKDFDDLSIEIIYPEALCCDFAEDNNYLRTAITRTKLQAT